MRYTSYFMPWLACTLAERDSEVSDAVNGFRSMWELDS